jgi:zinc finger RNA-binding protein
LQGDNTVQLVVLCAEKPTSAVLKRVVNELPVQLKKVSEEHKYTVTMAPVEGAVLVSDGNITVKVSLTSPLLREPAGKLDYKFIKQMRKENNEKFDDFDNTSFTRIII